LKRVYKCESCGYEAEALKIRTVGSIFGGNFMKVNACGKCNWFLFDSEEHKRQVLKAWKC